MGPDGKVLAGPILDGKTRVTADIDFSAINRGHFTLNLTGHYPRPDIFDVRLNPIRLTG